jgi:predicted PurR-regulated permease PerM
VSESVVWRVTSRAILFTLAVLVGLWLLAQISAVIVRVVLAVILAAGMKPLVDRLTARELRRQGRWTPPRGMVVLVVYVVTILLVMVAGGLIFQVVVVEVTNLVNGVPVYGPRVVDWANNVIDLVPGGRDLLAGVDVAGQVGGLVSRLFGVFAQAISVFQYVLGLASGLLDVLMILLLALYLTTDGPRIARYLLAFLPPDRHEQAARATARIYERLGGWVSGQLILCVTIGVMAWIGLTVIGVPYAVVLALIAGLMEAVPNIGPIISAVPAILVAALYSPVQALMVLVLYVVIQQLENYVIVPRVMSRAVELHPLAVLLALMVGGELMGVLGAVLAVPVTAAISVIVDEIRSERLAPSITPKGLEHVVSDDLLPKEGIYARQAREDAEERAEGRSAARAEGGTEAGPAPLPGHARTEVQAGSRTAEVLPAWIGDPWTAPAAPGPPAPTAPRDA